MNSSLLGELQGQVFNETQLYRCKDGSCLVIKVKPPELEYRLTSEFHILQKVQTLGLTPIPHAKYTQNNGNVVLVCSYVEGTSLNETCLTSEILVKIIEMLQKLHQYHVVHCDLKPEHIFITTDGNLKLIDFDLAVDLDVKIQSGSSPIDFLYLSIPNPLHAAEFRGCARFASINAHLGVTPFYAWDFESLGYLWLYLHYNSLPWSPAGGQDIFLSKLGWVLSNPVFEQLVRARTSSALNQVIPLLVQELNNPKVFSREGDGAQGTSGSFEAIHQTTIPLPNFTSAPRPVERGTNLEKSVYVFSQQTNTATTAQAEEEVRRFLWSLGVQLEQKFFPSDFSHYYNHFRKAAQQAEVDLFGKGISIGEFQGLVANREDTKLFIVSPSPITKSATSSEKDWVIYGEVTYLAKQFAGGRKELLFHKFEQLEADLIRYLSQHDNPHPIDLASRNSKTWGFIVVASTQSMENLVRDVEGWLQQARLCFPHLTILGLFGRLAVLHVHNTAIKALSESRSSTETLSNFMKEISILVHKNVDKEEALQFEVEGIVYGCSSAIRLQEVKLLLASDFPGKNIQFTTDGKPVSLGSQMTMVPNLDCFFDDRLVATFNKSAKKRRI